MKLQRLEIKHYRSVKDQAGDDCLVFERLSCLVGKNNAGKSNILDAIDFLIEGEKIDDSVYYERDSSRQIEVVGYFGVDETDFDRLKTGKAESLKRQALLDDGTIGICRRSDTGKMKVMSYVPKEQRLSKEGFSKFHSEAWDEKDGNADFRDRMRTEYPELNDYTEDGKEKTKGAWKRAHEALCDARPDGIEFVEKPATSVTGIDADLKNVLPRVIPIPAIKEVADATKTTRSGELGSLLGELAREVQDELDEAIDEAMSEVYKRLNVVRDGDEPTDERLPGLQNIEQQINSYVSETFRDVSVDLQFPNPVSESIFKDANVWIDEEGGVRTPAGDVGEGVKRMLVFSLLRTLADLRQGKLNLSEGSDSEEAAGHQPLLILYEEAELFLHPRLQKVLLESLNTLCGGGDQVIYTTHSPFMLQGGYLKSINLVSKSLEEGTCCTEFHEVLRGYETREQRRLTEVQRLSSYIFADRVLLVEGKSDKIVLEKIAVELNDSWAFDRRGVPVLPVGGRGDLALYRDFLEGLSIEVFVMADIDYVEGNLNEICNDEQKQLADDLRQKVAEVVESGEYETGMNGRKVRDTASKRDWNEVWSHLETLLDCIENGRLTEEDLATDEHLGSLEKLIAMKKEKAERNALKSESAEVLSSHRALSKKLLDSGILLLRGDLEEYYPEAGGNKIESAIEFDASDYSLEALRDNFLSYEDGDSRTDVERFLADLFAESTVEAA